MRQIILATLIVGLFGLFAPASYACVCVMPEVPEAFEQATAVFVGEVAEIIPPRTYDEKAPLADRLYTVKFTVERSLKEAATMEISILSDQGRGGCFAWGAFLKGKKYLVYADSFSAGKANEKSMAVLFSCNRTALLSTATDDVKEIEAMSSAFDYSFRRFSDAANLKGLRLKSNSPWGLNPGMRP